ncbi:MAG: hypothetical protein HY598_05355, partial [Candidatus Omnitrophica bacterium]|nr:hypothetical protein [Candidatus Omnitrophota bacterium]
VSLTAPVAGSTVSSTITVSATASDNVGVVGVQFLLDGANLGPEDPTSPYAVSWDTTTATFGTHILRARARDAAGNTTTSTSVNVTVDNAAPTVTMSAPAAGSVVSGNAVPVSATASDNMGVVGVQFLLDGAPLGVEDPTSPYSLAWDTTTATNGSHSLTARARDAAGNTTTSSAVIVTVTNAAPTGAGYALRFYGNGTTDIDRVKIPIDGPPRPADIGATDFTLEFWMKALASENVSNACVLGQDNWIYGNIMFDRDIWGAGDYGDYGVSLGAGAIAFGVRTSTSGNGICSSRTLTDGTWHHVAVTRSRSSGQLRIFLDGVLDGEGLGPSGDASYRDGRPLSVRTGCGGTCVNEPYLVLGAEKHDASPGQHAYRGWLDEIRLSNTIRYTGDFPRPTAPFTTDANTAALYHFDEGSGDTLTDTSGASGGPSNGIRRYGGTPPGPEWVASDAPLGGGTPDPTAPTITITAPTSAATFVTSTSPLTLSGTASDNVGITQVTWTNDRGGSGTASGTTSWSVSGIALQSGDNVLTVTARDVAGNTATDTLTVTYAPPADITPPTVSLTAPAAGSTVSSAITVSATASDNVGVVGVQFLLDGASLGVEDTTSPYSTSWSTATATNGPHTLSARARDAAGNQTASSVVSVTVNNTAPEPSGLTARGYQARACGFDMNRNGISGEPADCHVGDGVTLDPDGDGVNEDLLYVDCQNGSDTSGTGSPANPYRTIQRALNAADGPSDGAEDIVAFTGICRENLIPQQSGVAGTYLKPRSGNEVRDWLFPSNPAMVIGWDRDNDGQYPPVDPDDVSVLDGDDNSDGRCDTGEVCDTFAILNSRAVDYLEFAHFTAQYYGLDGLPGLDGSASADGGFFRPSNGAGLREYLYLHDLRVEEGCGGRSGFTPVNDSACRVLYMGTGGGQVRHLAVINVYFKNWGSYLMRGGAGQALESGPYRFQQLTAEGRGRTNGDIKAMKLWEFVTGIEVLDSIFDTKGREWGVCAGSDCGSANTNGLDIAQCTRDWDIVNNTLRDFRTPIYIQPNAPGPGDCTARNIDDVRLESNLVTNTIAGWSNDNAGMLWVASGSNTVERLQLTNNMVWSSEPLDTCMRIAATSGWPVTLVGNTCSLRAPRFGALYLGSRNYTVRNNVIAGLASGQTNVNVSSLPSAWSAAGNVYDPVGRYLWNGTSATTLAAWQTVSGGDANSRTCAPTFVNSPAGDLHLAAGETCAVDRGVDVSGITSRDFDGDARPQGAGWDAGADEVAP